ncbi:MAG: pitrilysin family protein [Acidobacteriota bacterium]
MQDNSFAGRTHRYELPNGTKLLVLENHANPTVSTFGVLKAGAYFNPPSRHGIASLTASMLNKGSLHRTKLEIAKEMESAGAHLGFSASTFAVSIGGQALSRDFEMVSAILTEQLTEPSFPADELEKLKLRTLAALKQNQEETRLRAVERLTQLVYPLESPFHQPTIEQLSTEVEAISVEDLRQFYHLHYGASSLTLVVVGDVDAAHVHRKIGELLGKWKGAPAAEIDLPWTPVQKAPLRELIALREKANADVVIGHASGLRRSNPDYLAAMLANRALGQSTLSSRLGLKVRDEMGLTYGINSSFMDSGLGDGPFVISVTVAPENVETAISTSREIVEEFISSGIREDELRDEQSAWIGSFKVGLATNAGIAGQLASAEVYGLGPAYLDRFSDILGQITKADVDEAIRRYFHPELSTTVIAGTFE